RPQFHRQRPHRARRYSGGLAGDDSVTLGAQPVRRNAHLSPVRSQPEYPGRLRQLQPAPDVRRRGVGGVLAKAIERMAWRVTPSVRKICSELASSTSSSEGRDRASQGPTSTVRYYRRPLRNGPDHASRSLYRAPRLPPFVRFGHKPRPGLAADTCCRGPSVTPPGAAALRCSSRGSESLEWPIRRRLAPPAEA